ncbi:MAG: type II secretion system F family protein [Oscillospiraceae bacterium]|nr:type II secretion system F family protein [Oscillospiraceae bacterium]
MSNVALIEKLQMKDMSKQERLSQYQGLARVVVQVFIGGDSSKEIKKLEQSSVRIQRGNLRGLNVFVMPGYVLQRKFEEIGKGSIHKTILTKCVELYGKKHASKKAAHLLAGLLSYPIIGVAMMLIIGSIVLSTGNVLPGVGVLVIGTALILVLVYAMYDELSDRINKRHGAIQRQFPNVVSKLALLVTSGMIMDKAWKETAYSQDQELYQEMRKTSEELDNLVSPEAAYGGFLDRCNTKETAKLASAIMQNLSKGNSEIGRLLKDLAKEAWQERRHTAKRDAEKANSKLTLPTMLLFLAILVMIMVPVAMSFSGL